jgi:iron complex transport system substrate-binding protein
VTLDPVVTAGASVLRHDPSSLEGVFHAIATLGAMTSSEDAALGLVEELRDQLGGIEERVRERLGEGLVPLRVVMLEWFEPPWTAGRWIPEQIRRAGGWELLGNEGEPSRPTDWEAIAEVDPEALFLMCRGAGLRSAMRAWERLPKPEGWTDLEAVRRGQVFAVDARTYFTEPGPQLVDGIALVAELLDPEGHAGIAPEAGWAPLV